MSDSLEVLFPNSRAVVDMSYGITFEWRKRSPELIDIQPKFSGKRSDLWDEEVPAILPALHIVIGKRG